MKRFSFCLLVALMITSTWRTAEAASRDKSKKRDAAKERVSEPPNGAAVRADDIKRERKQSDPGDGTSVPKPGPIPFGPPRELQLTRAGSRKFDLRTLPRTQPIQLERAELPEPPIHPVTVQGVVAPPDRNAPISLAAPAPAPPPLNVFEGLDRFNWGAGSPPDTNGDVGPNNYIQTVNTSIGVYRKSDGFQQAAFTFNTFMSQGNFGNLCDTNNFGDPVVLYDTFEGRWIISDFAFVLDGGNNVLAPAYQCFAASMTGDPISGGWSFYSIQLTDGLDDYPKFGIWPDGVYMSANMFSFGAGSTFQTARVWAFNKAQMYAGSPTVKVVSFDIPGGDFTVIPSNARLQTGTPPSGRPNLFVSTWQFLNALTVYKFHADWNSIALSTFTGPDTPLATTSWPNTNVGNAAQPGTATLLDVLQIRAMVQNQYTNFGGTESLWVPHTVRRANTSGLAAPRWYQVNVNGGTVSASLPQATTWDPDGANVIDRFMPSLALDRAGNMAMGYSTSSGAAFPSIKYAGRLAGDAPNTFSKTEQTFFAGTGSQTGLNRWGDYSGMTLDPDGCTFWYTTEYANPADQSFNHRWLTKFGNFRYTECTPVGNGGTIQGTVTATAGGAPISGASVQLGARTSTSDAAGNYSFTSIPAGSYPSMMASKLGFVPASVSPIAVVDGGTTTQNYSLNNTPSSSCLTDTTQADFLTGVSTNADVNVSPGDVTLLNPPIVDQAHTLGTNSGTSFDTPNWTGQTFTPAVSGVLAKVDVQLFCGACAGTTPNIIISVRNTAAGLPTGADLASATLPGFSSGAGTYYTVTFSAPATLTSGTQYALILRPVANPSSGGTYFWIRANPGTYAGGQRVATSDSGATWGADSARDFNFRAYMQTGYAPSGNLVSGTKDASPSIDNAPTWTTLSWTALTPANTSLKFQAAGANGPNGPFNFVGPDGTASTFFIASGASLSQFNGRRYLKYKAIFGTTDNTVTPVLNDVTVCFTDVACGSPAPPITPTPTPVCGGTSATAAGPPGMVNYSWSVTNGTITAGINSQTVTYTAGAGGTADLMLIVTDPSGCVKSNTLSVPILPNPLPAITPTPAIVCANSGGNTASGPAGVTSYAWSIVNGTITSATNAQSITYNAGISGTVGLTLVVTNPNGCIASNTVNVPISGYPATPIITPTPSTVCTNTAGNSAAGPVGATTYAWSIVNGTITSATSIQTITYTAGASGTVDLTLVVTNAGGCSATNTVNVPISAYPATPTITPTPATVCANSSGNTAAGPAATSYAWSIVNGTITSPMNIQTITYTAGASGTVDLTLAVTNAAGCSTSNTISVTINANPATPTITPTPATVCANSTGNSTAGPAGATTYAWSIVNGTITSAVNVQTIAYTAGASGTVVLTLVVTDASGCSATNTANVVINANPAAPTITPTPASVCANSTGNSAAGSAGATSYAWSIVNGTITSAVNIQTITYTAGVSGTVGLNLIVTNASGCSATNTANVTINPNPATPTISPNSGFFCPNGGAPNSSFVQLQSSAPAGNQWFLDGNLIVGANGTTYNASAGGSYTVQVTTGGCSSAVSAGSTVTAAPTPAPTITPNGPTTFCAGGSVTLTASTSNPSVVGYRWYRDGVFVTNLSNQLVVTQAGSYTADYLAGACQSFVSTGTLVTVNPNPNATITTVASATSGSTGNIASVANAGAGATYTWSVVNGTLSAGNNTPSITYTAGAVGTLTINVTVTTSANCNDAKSANVGVTAPPVTVTSVSPTGGTIAGGSAVTINGTGFLAGASVSFGSGAATNIVVVSAIKITARTPAHALGAVNVTVTNTNTTAGTLTNGYLYKPQQFDSNGDGVLTSADIFYLVNYLFMGGPAPSGAAGVLSGDANGDGVVNSSDIFFLVNYLFLGGPRPNAAPTLTPVTRSSATEARAVEGSITLGKPMLRAGRYVVPVIMTIAPDSITPQSMALRVHFDADGAIGAATFRRAGPAKDLATPFEITRRVGDDLSYLITYGGLALGSSHSAVVAEIEIDSVEGAVGITVDPQLTMLGDQAGQMAATIANGKLRVSGATIGQRSPHPHAPGKEANE